MSLTRISAWILGLTFFAVCGPLAAQGDPGRGKQLALQCIACHGIDGNSPSPVNPKIGGQHEEYLLLALRAYANGKRPDSLMSGAVLDKTDQELQDMAAYFASQQPAVPNVGKSPSAQGARGAPPQDPRRANRQFDHGERDSEFISMLAMAAEIAASRSESGDNPKSCRSSYADAPMTQDSDGDGLADRYDAAPEDGNEFVRDLDQDGFFEICSVPQLQAIANFGGADDAEAGLPFDTRRARSYELMADLDAADADFEPIGNCGPTGNCMRALGQFGYAGVFDGQGHVVRNLTIEAPERGGVALFGVLASSGIVMNLTLENIAVAGRAGVGSIVGSNFGVVYNCEADGSTSGSMAIGGLVGGSSGLVFDGGFSGKVTGKQAVGGLVGDMTGAVIAGRANVEIEGERGVGGLVGLNTFGSVIDSHAQAVVVGGNDSGGLVGVNTDAKVKNSFATGRVDGNANNIGGLVGFNSQSIVRNSFSASDVTGIDAVGGLIGRNNGIVSNGFAAGKVSAKGQSGAVVGIVVEGEVTGTYAAAERDLSELTGDSTGWAPEVKPIAKPLNFYCDSNRDGYIGPTERTPKNYIWAFDRASGAPKLRCLDGV